MKIVGDRWYPDCCSERSVSSQIRRQLDTVVSPKSKLTKHVKKAKGHMGRTDFLPRWSTGTSHPNGCCGKARSKDCRKGTDDRSEH